MGVPELIERADRWLQANRPDYYARLRPGATAEALDAFEAKFSLKLPDAFRQFYRWRNGQEGRFFAPLQQNFMFESLERIASTKETLDGMIGTDFEDPAWWRREWVPFLHNGGGDYLCVDLVGIDGGRPGQVVKFWHDDGDRPVPFPSFEAWLEHLVNSMENGTLELA